MSLVRNRHRASSKTFPAQGFWAVEPEGSRGVAGLAGAKNALISALYEPSAGLANVCVAQQGVLPRGFNPEDQHRRCRTVTLVGVPHSTGDQSMSIGDSFASDLAQQKGSRQLEQQEEGQLAGRRVFPELSMARLDKSSKSIQINQKLHSLQLPDHWSPIRSQASGLTPLGGTPPKPPSVCPIGSTWGSPRRRHAVPTTRLA